MTGVRLESNGPYWNAAWTDPAGKIVRRGLGAKSKVPKRMALAKCLELAVQHKLTPGTRAGGKAPTLESFLKRYFEEREGELSDATLLLHKIAADRLLKHFGGGRRLDQITRADAAGFKKWLSALTVRRKTDEGTQPVRISDSTVRSTIARVKVIIGYAVDLDLVPTDPFSRIPSGQPRTEVEWRFVTEAETERMMEACPDMAHRLLIALCRYAGLRRGEALRLTWNDVDEVGKWLTVIPEGHRETTKQRFRKVPIVSELMALLGTVSEREGQASVVDMPHNGLEKRLREILATAGVEAYGKPLHTLRKSCESDWLSKFPVMDVCAWLGHDASVAYRFYRCTTAEVHAAVTEAKR